MFCRSLDKHWHVNFANNNRPSLCPAPAPPPPLSCHFRASYHGKESRVNKLVTSLGSPLPQVYIPSAAITTTTTKNHQQHRSGAAVLVVLPIIVSIDFCILSGGGRSSTLSPLSFPMHQEEYIYVEAYRCKRDSCHCYFDVSSTIATTVPLYCRCCCCCCCGSGGIRYNHITARAALSPAVGSYLCVGRGRYFTKLEQNKQKQKKTEVYGRHGDIDGNSHLKQLSEESFGMVLFCREYVSP